MTIIAIVPAVICLLGAVLWGWAQNKAADAGRIMFAAGLLVTLFQMATHTLRIG